MKKGLCSCLGFAVPIVEEFKKVHDVVRVDDCGIWQCADEFSVLVAVGIQFCDAQIFW